MSERLSVRYLDGTWAEKITALRTQAFSSVSRQPTEKTPRDWSAFHYGPTDVRQFNIGLVSVGETADTGELQSILRIDKVKSEAALSFSLQTPVQARQYPAAVLSRLATAPGAQSRRLNLILRCVAVQALVHADYHELFGVFRTESRRADFMRSLGYELQPKSNWWAFDKDVYLARLDLKKNGIHAAKLLEAQCDWLKDPVHQAEARSLVDRIVVFLKT